MSEVRPGHLEKTIFQQKSWDLTHILPAHSDPEFDAELGKLKGDVSQFESMRGTLSPDISFDDLLRALKLYETIQENLARFTNYGFMLFSQDTSSQGARTLKSQMDELEANVNNRTLFFEHWLKKLDDKTHDRLVPNLDSDYRYYIRKMRMFGPYTLSEKEEAIINIKETTGIKELRKLYNQRKSRMQFVVWVDGQTIKKDGKTKKFTENQLKELWYSPDPKLREASYRSFFREYKKLLDDLGEIYIATLREWNNENLRLRHYPTPMSAFNLKNDIPDEAADLILSTCRENCGLFRDYFSIKARLLRMEKMHRYHLYAPIKGSEKKIPYSEAVDLILETFTSFDTRMGESARKIFELDHVDSEIREKKMGIAYSASINPKIVPYTFINYTSSIPDFLTLGHEIGHGVNTMLSSEHSQLVYERPRPVTEIGSVFAELLLMEKLMETETDPQVKQDLLVTSMNGFYATIPRQAYFVMFEKDAHDAVEKGVTIDELGKLYFSGLKEQFGNAVDVPGDFKWEWTYVYHFFGLPFYCISYASGTLVVLSLFNRYKKEGESFIPDYMKLLSYAGSKSPQDMLDGIGIDMLSRDFWQSGFDTINGILTQLEKYSGDGGGN